MRKVYQSKSKALLDLKVRIDYRCAFQVSYMHEAIPMKI